MEVICSSWTINDLHILLFQDILVDIVDSIVWNYIILITKLEESFHSWWRMFWTLSIISVRQKHYKTILHIPFCLSRTNELINNYLSSIGKITKLSLPNTQRIWVSLWVPQLITKDGKLRKMRVTSNELPSFSYWNNIINWIIISISILIEYVSMSVGESSSFNILTWYSYIIAIFNKRGKC